MGVGSFTEYANIMNIGVILGIFVSPLLPRNDGKVG